MRIKNVTRILAVVGFIALSVATSKFGAVKQRLAEKSSNLVSTSAGEVIGNNMLPEPTLLTQVEQGESIGCDSDDDDDCGCGCGCDLNLRNFKSCLKPSVCDVSPPCVVDINLNG